MIYYMWKLAMAIKAVYKPIHENRNGLQNLGHRFCNCKEVMLLCEDLMFLYILSTLFVLILIITVIVITI